MKFTILEKGEEFYMVQSDITEKVYLVKYHNIMNFTTIFHLVGKEKLGGFEKLEYLGYAHTTQDIFRKDVIDWVYDTISVYEMGGIKQK